MTEELTGFLAGLPRADAKLWLYHQDGHTLGSIALEAGPAPRQATLRWFGVKNTERGTGMGRQLLESALSHADLVFDAVWCRFRRPRRVAYVQRDCWRHTVSTRTARSPCNAGGSPGSLSAGAASAHEHAPQTVAVSLGQTCRCVLCTRPTVV